jgi:uncharacterized protein involved in outer membrane biogenesis
MPVRRKAVLWSVFTPLALVALLLVVMLTFDWNRIKPWLNQAVSDAIGRPFAINGDLAITWRRAEGETGWHTLVPWPRLSARDITIGNPDWASTPSIATVREFIFVLRPLPLLEHRIAIPSVVIDSPAAWLERRADGSNNWTFQLKQDPNSPSRWTVDVDEVVLSRANLSLDDKQMKIELQASADTIGGVPLYDRERDGPLADASSPADAPPAGSATPDSRYGIRWKATGHYNQATINATGKAGSVLSLRDADIPYPIQADARVGATRASIEGTLTNPAHLGALDVNLTLSGDSMASLYALTGIVLPATPPYQTRGRLRARLATGASVFTYDKFTGKVGGSDLSGTLTYQQRTPRPLLSGDLVSRQLLFADLAPVIGADAKGGTRAKDSPVTQPADKALPVAPFHTERWDSIDADVKFTGQRIVRDQALPISDLVTHIRLQDGVLLLDPLNFGVAGGNLTTTVRLDGKREPMGAQLDLTARHLKLKALFPTVQSMKASIGEINGSARMSAAGNSVAALLGTSNGEARLLVENGTISKFLLEAMGLNVGSVVISKLFGDKPVQINCGVSDVAFSDGIARARTFVLDTQDAVITTTGAVDLSSEKLALTVHPDSKGLRILSLRAPLYVGGTMKHPSVSPDIAVLALRGGGALALALLAPVATAVVPLMDISGEKGSQCATLLTSLDRKPTAPPPGKTFNDPKAAEARREMRQGHSAGAPPVTEGQPAKPRVADPPRPAPRPGYDAVYQGG